MFQGNKDKVQKVIYSLKWVWMLQNNKDKMHKLKIIYSKGHHTKVSLLVLKNECETIAFFNKIL